jgi:hypothetical protein
MPGCGTHEYRNISKMRVDAILSEAVSQGAVISGSNPWEIVSPLHGIVLRGQWDETTMILAISVVDTSWYVPCEMVWSTIDTMLCGFIEQTKDMEGVVDVG